VTDGEISPFSYSPLNAAIKRLIVVVLVQLIALTSRGGGQLSIRSSRRREQLTLEDNHLRGQVRIGFGEPSVGRVIGRIGSFLPQHFHLFGIRLLLLAQQVQVVFS
jgi:hypothetical protein